MGISKSEPHIRNLLWYTHRFYTSHRLAEAIFQLEICIVVFPVCYCWNNAEAYNLFAHLAEMFV